MGVNSRRRIIFAISIIHMINAAFTNIQSIIKKWPPIWPLSNPIYLTLCEEFARRVHSQYCYTLLELRYLPISLIRIKGIQIGDHEIKIVNFADGTTIFLRDITCNFKTMWRCIKHEDKIFKNHAFLARAYNNRIDQRGQMRWS